MIENILIGAAIGTVVGIAVVLFSIWWKVVMRMPPQIRRGR